MADILQPTDQFLVNRSDSTNTVTTENLMAELQDTDLLLVNRSDVTHKITGVDLRNSLKEPLELTVYLSTTSISVGGMVTALPSPSGGKGPYSYTFQWQRGGDVIAEATEVNYTAVPVDAGFRLKCIVEVTDADGDSVSAESPETDPVTVADYPPSIDSATLSGGPGFSGKTYSTTLVNYDEGQPAATLGMKAKVTGPLSVAGETSPIIGVGSTWNQSQVWSNGTTSGSPSLGGNWSEVFDADFTNGPDTKDSTPYVLTLDNSFTVSADDVFEAVHTGGEHGDAGVGITINGTLYPQSSGTTTVLPFTGTVNSIGIVGTNTNGLMLFALKLNGALLVDQGIDGAQPVLTLTDRKDLDNGAFLSGDEVTGYTSTDVTKSTVSISGWSINPGHAVMDGTNKRTANTANKVGKLSFNPPIANITLVEVFTRSMTPGISFSVITSAGDDVANGEPFINSSGTETWNTVYSGDPITFKEYFQQSGTADNGSEDFYALRLNGSIVTGFPVDAWTASKTTGEVDKTGAVPVTVVSISPEGADPATMTVSGGTWADDGSETVKNTVVNPISIKPESDEIVLIDQTEETTATTTGSGVMDYPGGLWSPTAPAPGTTSSPRCGFRFGRGAGTIIFNPPITADSKIEVYGYCDTNGTPGFSTLDGGTGEVNVPQGSGAAWEKININNTRLTLLAYEYGGGAQDFTAAGIYVDDEWFVGLGFAQLGLSGDKDLVQLEVNDDVYQNSGYAAETSEIISAETANVRLSFCVQQGTTVGGISADPQCAKLSENGLRWFEDRAELYLFNTNFDSHSLINDGDYVWPIFEINGRSKFTVATSYQPGYGGKRVARFSDDGINFGPIIEDEGDGTAATKFVFPNPTRAKYMAFGYSDDTTPATQVWGLIGLEYIDIDLTDDTDLEIFQAGDVVQSDWNQSQVWSSLVTPAEQHPDYTPARMFDGTEDGCIPKYPTDGGTGIATFVFPNTGNGVVRLTGTLPGSGSVMTVNGVAASFDTDIAFTGDMTLIWTSVDRFNYHRIDSVTIDGALLVDQGITDPNAVKVVSVSLDTNKITVDGGEWKAWNQSQVWSEPPIFNNGGDSTPNQSGSEPESATDGLIGSGDTGALPTSGVTWTWNLNLSGVTSVKLYVNEGQAGVLKVNGQTMAELGLAYNQYEYDLTGVITDLQTVEIHYTSMDDFCYLKGIKVDGKLLVDTWNQSQVWSNGVSGLGTDLGSNPLTRVKVPFNGDTTINSANRLEATTLYGDATVEIKFNFTEGKAVKVLAGKRGSNEATFNGVSITTIETADIQATWVDCGLTVEGENVFAVESISSNYDIFAFKVDGALLVSPGIGGDTTVSCTYQPGTGIVGSVDVPEKTITLSTNGNEYPKRWVANRGKFVTTDRKPAVATTAFLEFSGTQVTGLTSADPGYKPADPSLQLTFSDPAPSGSSWDTELPTGTTMQTRVFATNSAGTADSLWSNTVTGRKLPLDSTESEFQNAFLESTARISTFENRADVYQGQLAQQKRDDLNTEIAANLGITTAELEELVGEED